MPIVRGLKLSELPQVSSVLSEDLLLIETGGTSRSIEVGVLTSGLAAGISGDVSAIISGVFDTVINEIYSDIAYISGVISAPDNLQIDYSPNNYTESSNTISGHFEGIDNALSALSAEILSGGSLPSGVVIENVRWERILITAPIITTGSFTLVDEPVSNDIVRLWPQGGGHQINLSNALAGEVPDFEVSGTLIKINSNSSPTSALTNAFTTGDILNIVYETSVN